MLACPPRWAPGQRPVARKSRLRPATSGRPRSTTPFISRSASRPGTDAGKECFSFAANGSLQAPEFSTTWLGWSSIVAGAILNGEIYHPGPVPGATIVSRQTPTAAQAARWLSYMRDRRLGLKDGYSVARHNCRTFSQWEFRDAPSHW